MAASSSNSLGAVLKELGWSRKRLVAELRRQAGATGETLPETESLLALASRWVNNHQQPADFYRDLLAKALGRPRAELFSDEATRLELTAVAEPWLLARALEASSIGQAALEALEQVVGEFAGSYPSTAPTVLARPVLEHLRDVTRLLEGPLPVARRQRLVVVAGHLAGLAGSLAFDLRHESKALAYFRVTVQAADDAESPDLAAWALATRSLIPTYTGDPAAALRLLQEAQDRAHGHVRQSRLAWLAALEAKAHAGLGDSAGSLAALARAEHAIERAEPADSRLGTDFFDRPRLVGFRGTCHLLLGQPQAAQAALADVLALRDPADVKGRSLARLDLAQAYAQDRAVEEACAAAADALAIRHENRVGPILRRAREVRASLEPWRDEPPVRDLDEQLRPLLSA
jgi:tetratricopeptide (TPR) repeat protein